MAKLFFKETFDYINLAIKYLKTVIPAKPGGKLRLRSRNTLDAGSSPA